MRILTITLTIFGLFLHGGASIVVNNAPLIFWLLAIPGFVVWLVICLLFSVYLDEVGIGWGLWDE